MEVNKGDLTQQALNSSGDFTPPLVITAVHKDAVPFIENVTTQSLEKPTFSRQFLAITIGMVTLIVQLFASFATGGAVVVSQYRGRKDREASVLTSNIIKTAMVARSLLWAIALPFPASSALPGM